MPVNFPDSPTLNQTYTSSGVTWRWDGTVWTVTGNSLNIGATGATGITGATGPVAGADTQIVYNSAGAAAGSANLTFASNQLNVHGITIGRGAGGVATNTAVGNTALYSNITGATNTAVGSRAGYFVTSSDNTLVGNDAGRTITTGTNNTALGSYVMNNSAGVTGQDNVGIGRAVLSALTGGSYNTAVGGQALISNTTASNNTAVGYQAGYSNTTSIGLTAVGYRAGATKSTGFYITAIGGQALENATGDSNTAVGFYAMQATTTGLENVAVGVGAMQLNTTGSYNTAIGRSSLFNNTTASGSTAVGYQALYSNTSAGFNTALGYAAGYSNTTGNNNVFVGRLAGYTNSTGGYNVFIGYLAGYTSNKSTDGLGNTAIGTYAGYSLTTGDKNTFVGGNVSNGGAGYFITSGNANSILGNYNGNQGGLDIRTASNYIVLSDGDGNPRGIFDGSGNFIVGATSVISGGFGPRAYFYSSDVALEVSSGAGSTVGLGAAFRRTDASGGEQIRFVVGATNKGTTVGYINSSSTSTSYVTSSDYRLKNSVAPMTGALAKVAALNPVTFKWNADNSDGEGFIAHELAEVCPHAVTGEKDAVDADGNPVHQGIDTSFLVATLTAAIKELKSELDSVKAELATLKGN